MSTNTRSINNINHNNNNSSSSSVPSSSDPFNNRIDNTNNDNNNDHNNIITANSTGKRKRRPAGTPDPDAEVVSLSPRTLLESDRYVCEICNQGFQRDQNLQMHRRRHKVPWKLLKRSDHHDPANADGTGGGAAVMRKRVFVCPEPTCLHHDPRHALGDLVGIKKHFRRKHSNHKQWACGKCSKAYAVHSDFKAHLKTCGTRGHSCDCGRVFSRVESFIEHQDTCHIGRLRPPEHHIAPQPTPQQQPPSTVCSSRTTSSPSSDTNHNPAAASLPWVGAIMPNGTQHHNATTISAHHLHNLDLQLSIGSSDVSDKNESSVDEGKGAGVVDEGGCSEGAAKAEEMLKLAMAEMAYAEEARREAKRQIEMAESEFATAKKIRQQALAELEKAQALKEQAVKKINSTLMQITCHACKHKFQLSTDASVNNDDDNS